jgi:ubiquinone/menaquinone biosynthesis C-methylase UbiE
MPSTYSEMYVETVLDIGCGSGEEVIPLIYRTAHVIGIDISAELINIANRRLRDSKLEADLREGSAYQTELPDESIDIVFCMSLVHHLDIPTVREEMRRVLGPGGFIVLKEPVRFSRTYNFLGSLLPAQEDVSEYEHPLTKDEFHTLQAGFVTDNLRFFRLPFVPVIKQITDSGRAA